MIANVFGFLMVGTLLATIVITVILFVKKKVKRGFKTLGMGLLGVIALAFVLGVVSPDTPEQKAQKQQEAVQKAEAKDKNAAADKLAQDKKAAEEAKAKQEAEKKQEADKELNAKLEKYVNHGLDQVDYYNQLKSTLDKYNYAKKAKDECLEVFGSNMTKDETFQGAMAVGRSAWSKVMDYLEDPGNVAKQSKANEAVIQYQTLLAQAGQKYQAK